MTADKQQVPHFRYEPHRADTECPVAKACRVECGDRVSQPALLRWAQKGDISLNLEMIGGSFSMTVSMSSWVV